MTKKLEELLNVSPEDEAEDKLPIEVDPEDSKDQIEELEKNLKEVDNIEKALSTVELDDRSNDTELDEIAGKADSTFDNLMDLGIHLVQWWLYGTPCQAPPLSRRLSRPSQWCLKFHGQACTPLVGDEFRQVCVLELVYFPALASHCVEYHHLHNPVSIYGAEQCALELHGLGDTHR